PPAGPGSTGVEPAPMRLAALLVWLLMAAVAGAQELDEILQVQFEDRPDGSVIRAHNRQSAEVTLTVTLTENFNVQPVEGQVVTRTVPGNTRVEMIHLRPSDPGQRWSYNYVYHFTWGSLEARHDDSVVYALPYASGQTFQVIQGFNGSFSHTGDNQYAVDFDLPEGTPVLCAREGTVIRAEGRYTEGGVDEKYWTRANAVQVRHRDGTVGEYVHLKPGGVAVRPGQRVSVGDLLGYSGSTGYSRFPHLHFFVYKALDGYRRQSFPIRFRVGGRATPVEPVEGESYTAP
ncbi:MAG: M23 family metallopeptidase, partial [Candidatus Eremiobacterota bacterium]